jgi:signal transduction histidine kinase
MMLQLSLRRSIAARLAVGYGLLVALSIAAVSAVFYVGTVGVFERSIDAKIAAIAERMQAAYDRGGQAGLKTEIALQLNDRMDSDTEIMLLLAPDGERLAGNLRGWPGPLPPANRLLYRDMLRAGAKVKTRLIHRRLDGGLHLLVGRDLSELAAIRTVIERALLIGSVVSLLLVFVGALVFRRQLERRVGQIRRTANHIGAGELSRRIAVQGDDEFARLSGDINRMLDRIEDLMEGVRHVSNSIAHDLRTPLSRVRTRLDAALHERGVPGELEAGARLAIEDIDGVITVFDKLLQIATAESGVRPASFEPLDLREIARDMMELYEAAADEQGVALVVNAAGVTVFARGDRDLLASALASLIDNALKYGASGEQVDIGARSENGAAVLVVRDYGAGVPAAELNKVCQRFYRVDRSRHLPGNGLGLSIVSAIAHLHGGTLELANRVPGLEARLILPLGQAAADSAH